MQNMLRNALWTWGTYWEPIRNLEGTPWEHIGKQGKMEKNPSRPPNLKRIKARHLGPSHWPKFYCPSGFGGPAGTLLCPARPCWPPSQPVSPSPVPSPPLLATVTASQPLSRFCRAGPGRPSVTDLHWFFFSSAYSAWPRCLGLLTFGP